MKKRVEEWYSDLDLNSVNILWRLAKDRGSLTRFSFHLVVALSFLLFPQLFSQTSITGCPAICTWERRGTL